MRPAGHAYVDTALDLLQRHSIESAGADWPSLRAQAHAVEDADEAIRHVIAALGNPHTHLITAADRTPSLRQAG
ncbi:hypothetical protein [Lentzea sp. NPDC003310]|uniref:hypothetical protein n=1 Tax=Lentzea sp. NPDC003310 TaxID=3154447 RepID=UPI0033AC343D